MDIFSTRYLICRNETCDRRGVKQSLHEPRCDACGEPRTPSCELDPRRVGWAVAAAVLVCSFLGLSTVQLLERHRTGSAADWVDEQLRSDLERPAAEVFDAAERRFELSTHESLQLRTESDPQRRSLLERRDAIAGRARDAARDGRLSTAERDELETLAAEVAIPASSLDPFVEELLEASREAQRHLSAGLVLVEEGLVEEARAEFELATRVAFPTAAAWANLGAAHALLGDQDAAAGCYRQALELDPGSWLAHFNLAILAARERALTAAFEHLREALSSVASGTAEERRAVMQALLTDPELGAVREDPRFPRLLETGTGGER